MMDLLRLMAIWMPACRAYAGSATCHSAAAGGAWLRAALLAVVAALAGCAGLPSQVERPLSESRDIDATTRLAHIVAASTPAGKGELSGFALLADGEDAFQTRLALIAKAQSTLDVQYYQIANDRTGNEFLRALREAATRGVRVRVLVDDLYSTGEDDLFARLGAVPHVEVRMFNPLPVRGSSLDARIVLSLHQFSRINHRMHNKLFIADGSLAVVGGRNIADEYFGRSERANFIDADALVCGPVIGQLAAVFDAFWNSEHAYPIQSLIPARAAAAVDVAFDPAHDEPAGPAERASGSPSRGVADDVAAGQIEFSFGAAEVLADEPSKMSNDGKVEGAPSVGTRQLIEKAETSAFVSSPYFVPGANDMASIGRARKAGVDVQILTNSLQSTDEPLVYVGFARHAAALAGLGVDVREIQGDAAKSATGDTTLTGRIGASLSRLHAKLVVVDGRWSSIGSFNLDRRSALWNTEMVVHVDCADFAMQLEGWARTNVPGRTPVATNGPEGAASNERAAAPATPRWWQRVAVALVNEDQL